jgi:hypothetical protein
MRKRRLPRLLASALLLRRVEAVFVIREDRVSHTSGSEGNIKLLERAKE